MTTTTSSKHLWLELRPDYIDTNFEQVLSYLKSFKSNSDSEDTFYQTTLSLMRQRAQQLVEDESKKAIGDGEQIDRESDNFRIKLLCLYLITEKDTLNDTYKEAYFTLLAILARYARERNTSLTEQLVVLALEVLSCEKINNTGINWDHLNLSNFDLLIHNIISYHSLTDDPKRFVTFEKHGLLRANVGKVILSATNSESFRNGEKTMMPCISFLKDSMQVLDGRSNKIKQSEANNLPAIDAFTSDYVRRMAAVTPYVKTLKKYTVGDVLDVELISKGETLRVRTIDYDYEQIEGDLIINNSYKLLYYDMDNFRRYLNIGDQFPVKLQSSSERKGNKFSIDEEFKDCVVDELYKGNYGYSTVLAKLLSITTDKKGETRMAWWTKYGFPAYSPYVDGISVGEMAHIYLSDIGQDKYRHFINAEYDSPANAGETFDEEQSKKEAIRFFVYEKKEEEVTAEGNVILGENLPMQLCRLMYFYQRTIRGAAERYRILCTCRILAELVGDSDAARYIGLVADYLEDVVAFADEDYDRIKELNVPEDLAGDKGACIRADIVRILKEYGKNEDSDLLDSIIDESDTPLLEKLAKLVQSANRIWNVGAGNLLVHIRKEIISNLSIDTEDKTDLEESKGTYYGIEDITKEFKPSFFEAPDNSEHPQNWNVFKEICAFLNSELGGTLYLGVQDSGYSQGLERDMMNLRKIGNKAYADNIDGYKRYILDDAKKHFNNNAVLTNLTFTPLEDGKVLSIRVEPWESGIIKMDGQAFIRLDSESPVMDSKMEENVIRRKLLTKKDNAGAISDLMKACEDRKMVNLKGYASSSHTGTRFNMEPFAFEDNYQTVWCYDPESDRCKTYKVARIGSVEILPEGWKNTFKHRQGKTDIFRMTGDKEFNVEMQLDQYAKLLLCEEFPRAADLLQTDQRKESWYLKTTVLALEGVGRFYIGLGKQHITIFNSPELEEYVKAYVKESL